jgi:hypothetical protein
MPLYYKFTRKSDNTEVPLFIMDDLICEFNDVKPDPDNFSIYFNIITLIGDVSLSDGKWDEEKFSKTMQTYTDKKICKCARHFLNGEYIYDCWVCR